MILDSNIIIYAARPEHAAIRRFIAEGTHSVSAVSWIECFGYRPISGEEKIRLNYRRYVTPDEFGPGDPQHCGLQKDRGSNLIRSINNYTMKGNYYSA